METQQDLPLPDPAPSGTIVINERCAIHAEGEHRVVVVAGLAVHHYSTNDAVAQAYAMVLLADAGHATQQQIAVAFNQSERTVRRHQQRYHDGGMTALATRAGWRSGRRRVPAKRLRIVERLKTQGVSNREIARRLGVTENAIRRLVGPSNQRSGHQQLRLFEAMADEPSPPATTSSDPVETVEVSATLPPEPNTPLLLPSSTSSSTAAEARVPMGMSLDVDPLDRSLDRLCACFGLLDDAVPIFANAQAVPGAAVLCAVPLLVASGVFRLAQKIYGEIGPAFYGLRTILLTMLLMALWRIKRPEAMKEHDPQSLGRALGLDRVPEVKTIRRKLTRLASYHRAEELGKELARLRVDARGQLMGFLYVDGHVRVYHGKHRLPKTHVTRMRISLPATTDYWVNDQAGDPLFVITAEANAGLVKMLPEVLGEARDLVGDRHVTIVFGSPKVHVGHFASLTRGGESQMLVQQSMIIPMSAEAEWKP